MKLYYTSNTYYGGDTVKESLDILLDIQKSYTQLLKQMTHLHTVTIAEWQLLQNVADGSNTQSELVSTTKLDVSTLSRQLSKLVKKDLLAIEKMGEKPTERKKYLYTMTNKGQEVLRKMDQDFTQLKDSLFSQWTKEEQNLLKILLNRLNTSFNRIEN